MKFLLINVFPMPNFMDGDGHIVMVNFIDNPPITNPEFVESRKNPLTNQQEHWVR